MLWSSQGVLSRCAFGFQGVPLGRAPPKHTPTLKGCHSGGFSLHASIMWAGQQRFTTLFEWKGFNVPARGDPAVSPPSSSSSGPVEAPRRSPSLPSKDAQWGEREREREQERERERLMDKKEKGRKGEGEGERGCHPIWRLSHLQC